jgi:Icc-related predicted phosphoesterase
MEDLNPLPEGDVLIHAGDCTNVGKPNEVKEFVEWFMNVKGFNTKIFIAGNHDFAFEKINQPHHRGDFDWFNNIMNEENLSQSDVIYLEDSEFTIESSEFSKPIKFYGTPWQPEFFNWAFNLPRQGKELEEKWNKIPDDTDVLITHGPPHGIRDFVNDRFGPNSVGCELLRYRIEQVKPVLNVFGHIHEAYGAAYVKDILYVNASTCTERYVPSNKPIIIDLTEIEGILTPIFINE